MTMASINRIPFKLAISIVALVMLVLSQISMAHAMSAMGNGNLLEVSVSAQAEHHSDHHRVVSDSADSAEIDALILNGHDGGHGMADSHCAVSCSSAYFEDTIDLAPAYHADVRFAESAYFPASGTLQGLKRPPRI